MILCHPRFETILELDPPGVATLVVEAPFFYRELLANLYSQTSGEGGPFVLSEKEKELTLSTWCEIVDNPLRVDLNGRTLLNKIAAAMEKVATNESFFLKTAEIRQTLEEYARELAFSFDCDILCDHITPAGILKGIGLSIRDDYDDPLERLVDYMELTREFDRDRLFVLTNMRTFFDDDALGTFFETVSGHGFRTLLIDSFAREKISGERRVTIDADLCWF